MNSTGRDPAWGGILWGGTVAGTSAIYKRWPRAAEPIFVGGAYHVNLVDDATLVFDFADLGGYLNSVGCSVRVGGTGTVSLGTSGVGTSGTSGVGPLEMCNF